MLGRGPTARTPQIVVHRGQLNGGGHVIDWHQPLYSAFSHSAVHAESISMSDPVEPPWKLKEDVTSFSCHSPEKPLRTEA